MPLDQFAWTASSSTVYANLEGGILELRNDDEDDCVFLSVTPFEIAGEYARVSFAGEVAYGAPPTLVQSGVVSASHEAPHRHLPFGAHGVFRYVETELIETRILLPAHSACLVTTLDFDFFDGEQKWNEALTKHLDGETLVLASECPAWDGDADPFGVAAFAQALQANGTVDVVCPQRLQSCCVAGTQGMSACFAPYQVVRHALRTRRYRTIVVLGPTPELELILQSCNLGDANVCMVDASRWPAPAHHVDEVLAAGAPATRTPKKVAQAQVPVLSIAVPAYNTQDYLAHGVATLMNQRNAGLLEVLIVNDGSTDATLDVANSLAEAYNDPAHPIIRVIDKANGGHGSAICAGLREATGTYFRIMDSDDWADSQELEKLLGILQEEDSDIVLTDYSEDRAVAGTLKHERMYEFMEPGKHYAFDDVCSGPGGFPVCGPIMASSNFKTRMLQNLDFELPEHCYYVDMEFDAYAVIDAQTIAYYPLDIYRYFVGRDGQSVSAAAYIRNRKDHEHVINRMIKLLREQRSLSPQKHNYILNMVQKMVRTQYVILGVWMKAYDEAEAFDAAMKVHQDIYYSPVVCTPETEAVRTELAKRKAAAAQESAGSKRKGLLRRLLG